MLGEHLAWISTQLKQPRLGSIQVFSEWCDDMLGNVLVDLLLEGLDVWEEGPERWGVLRAAVPGPS